jgi:hypothetical protein
MLSVGISCVHQTGVQYTATINYFPLNWTQIRCPSMLEPWGYLRPTSRYTVYWCDLLSCPHLDADPAFGHAEPWLLLRPIVRYTVYLHYFFLFSLVWTLDHRTEIPVIRNITVVPIIKRSFKTFTVLFAYPEWYDDQNTLQGSSSPVFL